MKYNFLPHFYENNVQSTMEEHLLLNHFQELVYILSCNAPVFCPQCLTMKNVLHDCSGLMQFHYANYEQLLV